jgi:hypothetical protein
MLRLRDYIKAGATPPLAAIPAAGNRLAATATVATPATERPSAARSVATVATVAVAEAPEGWAGRLRCLAVGEGIRWDLAANTLDVLWRAGVVDKTLGLGWDARELVGVCRGQPHDSPSRAGLIWSVKPGDTVPDVRRSGCIIAYGNVRHIWKRAPIGADVCLPWELGGARHAVATKQGPE